MLNKITGCESRTVPPLYVLMFSFMAKAGHWEFSREGKRKTRKQSSARHKSEDLRSWLSHRSRDYGRCALSQKNGCGVFCGRRSLSCF